MPDNKNMILAIVLCLGILLAWDYFVMAPRIEEERARQEALQAQTQSAQQGESQTPVPNNAATNTAPTPGVQDMGPTPSVSQAPMVPGADGALTISREQALSQSRRVQIDSPRLSGSIALKGARIDDLKLKDYRETLDESSPIITVLNPKGADGAYMAEFGWAPGQTSTRVPGPDTQWSQVSSGALSTDNPVTLRWDNGQGLIFERTIAVDADYMFTVSQTVRNTGQEATTLYPYGLVKRFGVPEVDGFMILHEGLLGVFNSTLTEVDYDEMQEEKSIETKSKGGWLGITDKYWMTAVVPDQSQDFQGQFTTVRNGGQDIFQSAYIYSDGLTVSPGAAVTTKNDLFVGAKKVDIIERYERDLGIERFDLSVDWGWLFFLTKPFFKALAYFGKLTGNFGIAILLLTVLIKLVLYPFANKSYVAMSKMKKLQPEMTKIRDRFEDDKMRQQQELMELYKREKVNPMAGCWPMLVQIPVFFALYKVLYVTIEMRHAPFFGWVQDLSAPDPTSIFNLFGLLPWSVPAFLLIGIWPIFMGLTMYVQQKLNPAPADPVQEKIFMFMPLFFTFLLASFPAGLVIYWAWNNLLSIIQQYYMMTRMGVEVNLLENMGLDKLIDRFKTKEDAAEK